MHNNSFSPMYADAKTISQLTGIPIQTIREMTRKKNLPARKRGNIWIYKIEEVVASLDALPAIKQVDSPCIYVEHKAAERVPMNKEALNELQ